MRRRTRAIAGAGSLGGALPASLLLAGCGTDAGGAEPGAGAPGTAATATPSAAAGPSGTSAPAPSGSTAPGTLPTAYAFTPDPARVPRTAGEARRFTRAAALDPDSWSAGMVRHEPAPLHAAEAYDAVHLPARCAQDLGRVRVERGDLLASVRGTTYQGVSKKYAFEAANGTFTGDGGLYFYTVSAGRFRLLGDRPTLWPA
ncbi:hypothetical protein AB0D46_06695 [Streptomyces sp. NPDC048383]|uniref:hypothetical protein n=1 Tax=Streptomyces sp. NPDC048383 TaxID=3155386 RepID=UPI0034211898